MNLELNEQEINVILTGLIQLPFKDVAGLILKINDTIQKQATQGTTEGTVDPQGIHSRTPSDV